MRRTTSVTFLQVARYCYVMPHVPTCSCIVIHMDELTDNLRRQLASSVRAARIRRFGSKADAYRAAGLNSATWDRIEAAAPVREDRLIAALKTLFPASDGDWRRVLASRSIWDSATDRPISEFELGTGGQGRNRMTSHVLMHQGDMGVGELTIMYESGEGQWVDGNGFNGVVTSAVDATQQWLDASMYRLAAHHNDGKGREREAREDTP